MKAVRLFNLAVVMLLAFSFLGVAPAAASTNAADGGSPIHGATSPASVYLDSPYVPGEVIVGFASGRSTKTYVAQASALADTVGAQVVKMSGSMALLSFDENADVNALVAQLSAQAGVQYAEPNYISSVPEESLSQDTLSSGQIVQVAVKASLVGDRDAEFTSVTRTLPDGTQETVPLSVLQAMRSARTGKTMAPTYPNDYGKLSWDYKWTKADLIWSDPAPSPMVCVVDTGVDILQPDLLGKVVNGYDYVNDDPIPNDDNGHGTHVTGTIAALMNNKLGIDGISNGKVLAVKVLSEQGWGTDFDIATGITFCANNPLVKVINLSLGGKAASTAEYLALQYAINTKGKLVVAAAGNDSLAWNVTDDIAPAFPAGWASQYICQNGHKSGVACNNIYQALLAVGAAGSPWRDNFWVDTDGSTTKDANEVYSPWQCGAYFGVDKAGKKIGTNFGSWVEIVAPGQDIWSTTPTTHPFWYGQFWGAQEYLDSWSGTSMAAPHVSGGAVRAWSVNPGQPNFWIKAWLLATGNPIDKAEDPNIATLNDLYAGYNGSGYAGDAPFCWPNGVYAGGHDAWADMSNSVYLNVAAAMNRGGLEAQAVDATTAMGMPNTTVQLWQNGFLKGTAKNDPGGFTIWYDFIDLPAGPGWSLKVSNTSTAGFQTFMAAKSVIAGDYGNYIDSLVAIPPGAAQNHRITGVLTWEGGADNLDLYSWLPLLSSGGAVVGSGASGNTYDVGPGKLYLPPYARWNRDGGAADPAGVESISIVPRPGNPPGVPFYFVPGDTTQGYDFLVTGYGAISSIDPHKHVLDLGMVFRYWVGGVIKATVIKAAFCDHAAGEDWWEPGKVGYGAANLQVVDECGTGDIHGASPNGIWPYIVREGISSSSGK